MHKFNANWRWLGLTFLWLMSFGLAAQTYIPQLQSGVGSPGGLNTLSNTSTTGWTEIIPPSISTNQWSAPVTIPFAFDFDGTPVTELRASGNGLVTFLSNPGTTPPNPSSGITPLLTDPNLPDSTIAAFWTDFTTATTGSNDRVYTQTFGSAPNRQFWVKWHSYEWGASGATGFVYVCVVLEESTNNIYVIEQYSDSPEPDTDSCVVGIRVDGSNTYEVSNPVSISGISSSSSIDDVYGFYNGVAPASNPFLVSVTSTTAEVSANVPDPSTGVIVQYGLDGFTLGSGTILTGANDTVAISGLTPATEYDAYIANVNGNDTSSYVGPLSFQTNCVTVTTFPFIENFDSTNVWSGSSVDPCWTQVSTEDEDWIADANGTSSSGTGPADDLTGGQYLYLEGTGASQGDSAILISPTFDVTSLTAPYLTYFIHMYGGDMGDLLVETTTDGGATWTSAYTISGQVQTSDAAPWTQIDVALPSSSSLQIRFIAVTGSSFETDMAIDSVRVGEMPSCTAPAIVTMDEVLSSTELTVNWTNTTNNVRVEWGLTGFQQGTGTPNTALITAGTGSYTITGLFRNTEYDVYVYSDCGVSPVGQSMAMLTGQTLPAVPSYYEPFTSFVPDDRWEEASGDLATPTVFTSTSASWASDDWLNVTSSPDNAARIAMTTTADDWFFSPLIDMGTGGQYELIFNAAITTTSGGTASNMEADDSLFVVINNDTNQVWNASDVELIIESSNEPSNAGNVYRVDLSAYTGLVRVGFFIKSTVSNTTDYNFYIDNFRIRPIPQCAEPTGLAVSNISESAASITWTPVGAATNYVVYVALKDSSTSNPTTIVDTVAADSAYITGLMSNTAYDVYVTTLCGNLNSLTSGPTPFITDCSVFTAPTVFNFEGLDQGAAPNGKFANCVESAPVSSYIWEIDESTGSNTHSSGTGPNFDNTLYPASGGSFIYTEATSGSNGDTAQILLPRIDVTTLTTPALKFFYHMYGDDFGTLQVDVSADGSNWTNAIWSISGKQHDSADAAWDSVEINLSSFNIDTVHVRFTAIRGSSFECDIALDDITVDEATAACSIPLAVNLSNLTSTSVDIAWVGSATSYTAAISLTGDPTDTANTTFVTGLTGNSTTLNLPLASCVDIYLLADCGAATSTWVNAGEVCTPCPTVFPTPYFTNLEGLSAGEDGPGIIDNCWNLDQGTSDPTWETEDASGTDENSTSTGPHFDNTNFPSSGGIYMYMEVSSASLGDTAIFESPQFYVGNLNNRPALEFYYHMYGADMGNLYIQAKDETSAWMTVDSIIGQQQTSGTEAWRLRTVVLDNLQDTIQVRFIGVAGSGFTGDMSLDDIAIVEAPSCPDPTNLASSNITTTSVDLSWNTYNPSATILVEYGSTGFAQGSGTVTTVTGNPATLSGLSQATCYDVYLREVCAAGDSSAWIGPVSICTDYTCDPNTVPGAGLVDTFICTPGTLSLSGASNEIYWEDASGQIYHTGSPYMTDTISGDTALYARGYNPLYSFTFGPSTDISTAGFGNFSNGEMITVNREVRIDTVTFKSNGAKSGTIQFSTPLAGFDNNYGDGDLDTLIDIIQTVDFSLPGAGDHRVPVGAVLKPGIYFVNISFDTTGVGELFRATGGANYPYTFSNIMSIDSAVGVSNFPSTRVYYFFDWTVSPVCSGNLDTTNIEFAPEAVASFTENSASGSATATDYSVFFDATASENGVSYDWDFGDGATGSGDTLTHVYTSNGTYTVQLVVTGVCGDTDTVTTTVDIQGISVEEVAFDGSVNVFPNPTSGVFNVQVATATAGEAELQLLSLSGQVLHIEKLERGNEWNVQIDISDLPQGTYMLTIRTADGTHVERVVRY